MDEIKLEPMTAEMYHSFFREYQNDPDLYLNKSDYVEYMYDPKKVDEYIERQVQKQRLPFAIMCGNEIIGELKLYDIVDGKSATLGIALKNSLWTNRGFGTRAEKLAVEYVFRTMDIPTLYADTVLTNTRSQHVLEKVGFQYTHADDCKKYYRITRKPH